MAGRTLLNVNKLRSGYGNVAVINGLSFDVKEGEIVAIVGRNGVGKTTLLKTLIGELPCQGGDIEFRGRSMNAVPAAERAQLGIGYVPQGRGLFTGLSVEDNLRLGKLVGGRPKEMNFDRVYGFFPILKTRLSQIAGTMSGGQQQQLSIGRILIGNPSIMLLDEPFAGIDPLSISDIRDLVKDLKTRGIGVLITDHNVRETLEIVDRACIIYGGQVLFAGTPEALVADENVRRLYLGESFTL